MKMFTIMNYKSCKILTNCLIVMISKMSINMYFLIITRFGDGIKNFARECVSNSIATDLLLWLVKCLILYNICDNKGKRRSKQSCVLWAAQTNQSNRIMGFKTGHLALPIRWTSSQIQWLNAIEKILTYSL